MKQQRLFKQSQLEFGGLLLHKKRKSKRPLSPKSFIHLVLKADISESKSLLRHRKVINEQLNKWSEKFGVQICDRALCSNHIHMNLEILSEDAYNNFVRVVTGRLAQLLKVKWTSRPYTRLVRKKGRPSELLKHYILKNHQEAIGLRPYLR